MTETVVEAVSCIVAVAIRVVVAEAVSSIVTDSMDVIVVLAVSSSVTTRVKTADEEAVACTYLVVGDVTVSVIDREMREVSSMTVVAKTT